MSTSPCLSAWWPRPVRTGPRHHEPGAVPSDTPEASAISAAQVRLEPVPGAAGGRREPRLVRFGPLPLEGVERRGARVAADVERDQRAFHPAGQRQEERVDLAPADDPGVPVLDEAQGLV